MLVNHTASYMYIYQCVQLLVKSAVWLTAYHVAYPYWAVTDKKLWGLGVRLTSFMLLLLLRMFSLTDKVQHLLSALNM